jgi:glycosyltransferase involved in cell wall biosynthesis
MVAMLSKCDRVIAVSNFVRRKFEAMGVDGRVLTTLPIGSRMPELRAGVESEGYDPPPFDRRNPRPIRAVFMGYHNYFKGLPMLLDALGLLTPEYLGRLQLAVYAKDLDVIRPRLERLEPMLAGLTTRAGYRYDEVPALLRGKDLGLVPSVWWDNGPQTVMEFFSCGLPVLGAELGGIPDLVRHGHNGLLYRGNDRFDLARTLAGIIKDPAILTELRQNVRQPRGMAEHARAMESLYNECLGSRTQ